MVETMEIKHHLTKKVITGYGITHLINNYNAHTMNETRERGDEHFIKSQTMSIDEIKALFAKKPEVKEEKPKEEKPKKESQPKTTKKKGLKKIIFK